jgi:hypothetical protein
MIQSLEDHNYLIFNPDTLWGENYVDEINQMQNYYFSRKLNNILLTVNKILSFDKKLEGDFELKKNLCKRNAIDKNFIYTGCQILNKNLFSGYEVENFSISKIWDDLLKKDELNGFESQNNFYHLTDLDVFNKLKDF